MFVQMILEAAAKKVQGLIGSLPSLSSRIDAGIRECSSLPWGGSLPRLGPLSPQSYVRLSPSSSAYSLTFLKSIKSILYIGFFQSAAQPCAGGRHANDPSRFPLSSPNRPRASLFAAAAPVIALASNTAESNLLVPIGIGFVPYTAYPRGPGSPLARFKVFLAALPPSMGRHTVPNEAPRRELPPPTSRESAG